MVVLHAALLWAAGPRTEPALLVLHRRWLLMLRLVLQLSVRPLQPQGPQVQRRLGQRVHVAAAQRGSRKHLLTTYTTALSEGAGKLQCTQVCVSPT